MLAAEQRPEDGQAARAAMGDAAVDYERLGRSDGDRVDVL